MVQNFKWFMGTLAVIAMTGLGGNAVAQDLPQYCYSAEPDPNVTYEEFLENCMPPEFEEDTFLLKSLTEAAPAACETVYCKATLMSSLDFTGVPVWTDAEIMAFFAESRDDRYLAQSTVPGYPRRISWLYPNDGCFARAEQVIGKIVDESRKPFKLYALDTTYNGSLVVKSKNVVPVPGEDFGYVNWWYHVVPVVQNTDGDYMVLDASIQPCGPLYWEDWLALMTPDGDISVFDDALTTMRVSISDYNAYGITSDNAYGNTPGYTVHLGWSYDHLQLDSDTGYRYLWKEWNRQTVDLGRDAEDYFGDDPVWLDDCGIICTDDTQCDDGNPCTQDTCNLDTYYCEYTALSSVYEAETDMYHQVGNAYLPDGWNVHSNGYISFWHTFGGGTEEMTVRAAGAQAGGSWPIMRIDVNGTPVRWFFVTDTTWQDYNFTFASTPGTYEVRINFINDYYNPPEDRNLYVDKAVLACNPSAPPGDGLNLGPVNTQTIYTVSGSRDLIINQLDFSDWNPPATRVFVSFAAVDGGLIDGISVSVDGGPAINLSGYYQEIQIPLVGQPEIHLTVNSPTRELRTQWWAQP